MNSSLKMHEDTLEHKSSCEKLKNTSVENSPASSSKQCESKVTSAGRALRQQIIDSDWGGYALDLNLWEDSRSPVVQIGPDEISLDNRECYGILTDRLVGVGSSYLTRSPETGLYILGKFVMRNKHLTDVTVLRHYRYLQYVDIAYNDISCLSSLSCLPYLTYLNVSHNKIENSPNFTPPWYLTYVNLSYNNLTDIGTLRNCWSIVRLNLSHNIIEDIFGLKNLKYLQYLNLSYNLIECIENLDDLNIVELNLECNCITSFRSATPGRGINVLPSLRTIHLAHNRLATLRFFRDAYSLRFVDLKHNKITDLLEVLNLKGFVYEVDFRGNGCTKWPNYRNVLISSIPSVRFIDGIEVFEAEKVKSATLFAPSLDLTAAGNVAKLTLLEQLNINKIHAYVQPYDEISPPLIILTGPSALNKMMLALQVAKAIPDEVRYCRWHTTKEAENDDERNAYVFVNREKFNDMARRGEFIVILDLLGHSYGFHTNQITPLVLERKIGFTQINLPATLEISKQYPNVKVILAFARDVDLHRNWAREKYDVCTWLKDSVENLLVVKIGRHVENDVETVASMLRFIEKIIDEVMECMELPSYSTCVRPQGTGATMIDIIVESKTMLPKVIVKRSEIAEDKRKSTTLKSFHQSLLEERSAESELKPCLDDQVLLDEDANVIVDDESTKREMHKTRMMKRRVTLEMGIETRLDLENDCDVSDSTSVIDLMETTVTEGKAKALKNMYVELVINSRQLYLDYHESHPGFFSLVLLMDDHTGAYNSLVNFIHELRVNQSYRKPIFLSEVSRITQTAIPSVLESVVNEMRENLSISKLQRKMIFKMHDSALRK